MNRRDFPNLYRCLTTDAVCGSETWKRQPACRCENCRAFGWSEPAYDMPMKLAVLAWLGRWRDDIPPEGVAALQDVLGMPASKA